MSINKMFLSLMAIIVLSACSSAQQEEWFVSHTGNMPAKERVNRIDVGSSKDEVLRLLGEPSSVNVFDQNSWIYMSTDIKKVAFFAPAEADREILHITFDAQDKVQGLEKLTLEDGKQIAVEKDKTDIRGQRAGFFRKYFGGVGQYTPFNTKNNRGL